MTRREIVRAGAAGLGAAALATRAAADVPDGAGQSRTRSPNLVLIHTHDSGRHLEPYGYPVPTPHLQRFSERATLFRQLHAAAPTCSPSRAALLTGATPHRAGMLGLAHRGFPLEKHQWHLAHLLKENGYRTVLCGIQHECVEKDEVIREQLGYDEIITDHEASPRAQFRDVPNARRAATFLREQGEGPFFLNLGLFNTHRAFPLYDLVMDPDEGRNLADQAEYAGIQTDLEQRLKDWMEATDDPLVHGPVPLPEGAMPPVAFDDYTRPRAYFLRPPG